jgi:hypothetical protein
MPKSHRPIRGFTATRARELTPEYAFSGVTNSNGQTHRKTHSAHRRARITSTHMRTSVNLHHVGALLLLLNAFFSYAAMGSDHQLGITGQTQNKTRGANVTTFANARTDTRVGAVDCSAEMYAALTSYKFDAEDREELAYFLHANVVGNAEGDPILPDGARNTLKRQIDACIRLGEKLGCRLAFF